MKLEIERPTHLVDISRLPLRDIEELPDGGLRIGAQAANPDTAASRPWVSSSAGWRHSEDLRLTHRLLGQARHRRWHYDLLFLVVCLVVATTGRGRYVVLG